MEKIPDKLVIIKYGTAVLLDDNGNIDYKTIENHGQIINNIDHPVIIVSSGAVGFGKSLKTFDYIEDEIIRKRVQAGVGNPHLSIVWDSSIKDRQVIQSLVTHRDLKNPNSIQELQNIIYSIYLNSKDSVIQFNENDILSDEELKVFRGGNFGDNDITLTLLADLCYNIFSSVEVIVNTLSDGVLQDGKLIDKLNSNDLTDQYIDQLCQAPKTSSGTGGMRSKLTALKDLSIKHKDVNSYIINGKDTNQLKMLLGGESIGTKIYSI